MEWSFKIYCLKIKDTRWKWEVLRSWNKINLHIFAMVALELSITDIYKKKIIKKTFGVLWHS